MASTETFQNMGPTDRGFRLALGIVMIATMTLLPIVGHWIFGVLGMVGSVLALSAVTGFCPLYLLANIDTGSDSGGTAGSGGGSSDAEAPGMAAR
jgi:hypothetical protein